MSIPEDPIARMNELRQRVLKGESLSDEEQAEAVKLLRASRAPASAKATASKAKSKPVPMDLNELFN